MCVVWGLGPGVVAETRTYVWQRHLMRSYSPTLSRSNCCARAAAPLRSCLQAPTSCSSSWTLQRENRVQEVGRAFGGMHSLIQASDSSFKGKVYCPVCWPPPPAAAQSTEAPAYGQDCGRLGFWNVCFSHLCLSH